MKWKRVPKEKSIQPSSGSYNSWKEIIATEGEHQCVYCAIHDASFGGIRNFHVEHYKPKSLPAFKHLVDDIRNLYYACPICNTFKTNDWPFDPVADHSVQSYPDPAKVDYCDLFDVDFKSGTIMGKYVASKYMVEKMHLNRNQLVIQRRLENMLVREDVLTHEICNLTERIGSLKNKDMALHLYNRIIVIQNKIIKLQNMLHRITPYRSSETS